MPLALDLDVRDVVTARGVAAHVRHNPEELVFARPVLALAGRLGVPGCRRGTSRLARRGVNLGNRGVEVVGAGEEPVRRALDVPVASGERRRRVIFGKAHRREHRDVRGVRRLWPDAG